MSGSTPGVLYSNPDANEGRPRVIEEGISSEVVPPTEEDSRADINPEPLSRRLGNAPNDSRRTERRRTNVDDDETKKLEGNFQASHGAPRFMVPQQLHQLPAGERSGPSYNQEAFHGNKAVLRAYEAPPSSTRVPLGEVAQAANVGGWLPGDAMGGRVSITPGMGRPNNTYGLRYSNFRMRQYATVDN